MTAQTILNWLLGFKYRIENKHRRHYSSKNILLGTHKNPGSVCFVSSPSHKLGELTKILTCYRYGSRTQMRFTFMSTTRVMPNVWNQLNMLWKKSCGLARDFHGDADMNYSHRSANDQVALVGPICQTHPWIWKPASWVDADVAPLVWSHGVDHVKDHLKQPGSQ